MKRKYLPNISYNAADENQSRISIKGGKLENTNQNLFSNYINFDDANAFNAFKIVCFILTMYKPKRKEISIKVLKQHTAVCTLEITPSFKMLFDKSSEILIIKVIVNLNRKKDEKDVVVCWVLVVVEDGGISTVVVNVVLQGFLYSVVVGSCEGIVSVAPL